MVKQRIGRFVFSYKFISLKHYVDKVLFSLDVEWLKIIALAWFLLISALFGL